MLKVKVKRQVAVKLVIEPKDKRVANNGLQRKILKTKRQKKTTFKSKGKINVKSLPKLEASTL